MEFSSTYRIFGGLDAGTVVGDFFFFVELYQGPTPISWTVTATIGNGEVVFMQEGEFNDDCVGAFTSTVMEFDLVEYVDNGCEEGGEGFGEPAIESRGGGRRAVRRV